MTLCLLDIYSKFPTTLPYRYKHRRALDIAPCGGRTMPLRYLIYDRRPWSVATRTNARTTRGDWAMASTLLRRVAATARVLRTAGSWRTSSVRHLPVCSVDTNVQQSAVPKNFNKDLAFLIGTLLKKSPEVSKHNYNANSE